MDLQYRALATADWLKEATVCRLSPFRDAPLESVCSAMSTRFPRALERGDAILSAAAASRERISQIPSSILSGPLRHQGVSFSFVRRGLALAEATFSRGLARDGRPGREFAERCDDDDDEDQAERRRIIPRPLQLQAHRISTVQLSRFAAVRVVVACSSNACEALVQRLQTHHARPILAKLCLAAVQSQLSRRGVDILSTRAAHLGPFAAHAAHKLLGDRLTVQVRDVFQRLTEALIGSCAIRTDDDDDDPDSKPFVLSEGEPLDCTVLQGERGPLVHVPLQCGCAVESAYLQPLEFRLVERNGFLEYADEEALSPKRARPRSYSDSMVLPESSCQPYSLRFDCVDAQAPAPAHSTQSSTSYPSAMKAEEVEQHSVQLKKLPSVWSRDSLLELLDSAGFWGKYQFAYLPVDFTTGESLGYADVYFESALDAWRIHRELQGFQLDSLESVNSAIEVVWSDVDRQDLEHLIARYRDSPVMHETVPDHYRPVLFERGVRVAFPEPTVKLRQPRIRKKRERRR